VTVRRIEGKGIDVVTRVHSLIGVVWIASATIVLVLAAQVMLVATGDASAAWTRISVFEDIASACSVAMLLAGLVFGFATTWGFFRNRLVVVNWVLFIAATAFGGPSISMTRAHSAMAVIALTVAEIVVLVAASAVGVRLRRMRRLKESSVA
jgi:hypothetical protein